MKMRRDVSAMTAAVALGLAAWMAGASAGAQVPQPGQPLPPGQLPPTPTAQPPAQPPAQPGQPLPPGQLPPGQLPPTPGAQPTAPPAAPGPLPPAPGAQPAPGQVQPAPTAPPASTQPPPAPTEPPPPPPPSFPPNVTAGGLTPPTTSPPPPPTTTPPPTETEKKLDEAKKDDSKRGLEWVWLNAEGGFSYVDLKTFVGNDDFTFGFVDTQATGGMVGAGLGVRLLFITLGARGRIGFYDPWQMFTVGGELGVHIPIGRIDLHFALGGGYAALGSVNALAAGAKDAIGIAGGYGRVNGGVDVYITPIFSVGVMASGDFLAMVRPGLSTDKIADIKNDPSISAAQRQAADGLGLEGSSYGTAVGVTGVLGLHF